MVCLHILSPTMFLFGILRFFECFFLVPQSQVQSQVLQLGISRFAAKVRSISTGGGQGGGSVWTRPGGIHEALEM